MPLLQNEINQARAVLDAAQQVLTQQQQQLATLQQSRTTAIGQRDAASSQLTALQPAQAERIQVQSQLTPLELQIVAYTSQASQYAQQAAYHQGQASAARSQLATLQTLASQLPGLQAEVNRLADVIENIIASIQYLDETPYDPDEIYERIRERAELVRQRDAATQDYNAAYNTWLNASNQVATIPSVQQTIANADSAAATASAQQAAAQSGATTANTQAAPLRTRLAQLDSQLAVVPALQAQRQAAVDEIVRLDGLITPAQAAVAAATPQVTAANQVWSTLVSLAQTVEQEPLNRPALEQAAATLGAQLAALQEAKVAARTRLADTLERSGAVTAVHNRRQAALTALNQDVAATQAEVSRLTGDVNTIQTALTAAQTNLANRRQQVTWHQDLKPMRGDYEDRLDWLGAVAEWWDDLETLTGQFETAKAQVLALQEQLVPPDLQLQAAQARLAALQGQATAVTGEITTLQNQLTSLAQLVTSTQAELTGLETPIAEYQAARDTATARLLGFLPSRWPLLLLPVRLETRFVGEVNSRALWVRIYPDDIHVDSHEPELTAEEQSWGQNYWQAVSAAGGDEETRQAAWYQLATRFGVPRAAWIAQALDPVGSGNVGSRTGSWTRAPHSRVLPDRWVVLAARAGQTELTAWSGPVTPETLPVGPSPQTAAAGAVPGDPAMAWMADFDAAVAAGMALRIPLTPQQASSGFDRLIVVGVKAFLQGKDQWSAADLTEASTRLGKLLDAHHYTHGLACVPQSTPTNNTADQGAGYASDDPLDPDAYTVERGPALMTADDGSDGALLARALGLPVVHFAHVRGANGGEQRDAQAVNSALWTIVQSHFLEAVLVAPTATAARDHFNAFVRARGPLPVLRVGHQPYGLLPASSLAHWVPAADETDLLARLRVWLPAYQRLGERAPATRRQGAMVDILTQHATVCRYAVRGIGGVTRQGELMLGQVDQPFAARLSAISTRPAAVRQALVAETLDLTAFRLDAWVTSLATRRLSQTRSDAATASGIHLGSYGWVENLRPTTQQNPNRGYIHAPSLAQAAAAAVLRSGYLAHRGNGSGDALAVDLSSDRVHRVRWLLNGVREGQPLGALLGYRFERALHDQRLDHAIAPLRILAALKSEDAIAQAIQDEQALEMVYRDRAQATAQASASLLAAEQALAAAQDAQLQTELELGQRRAQRTQLIDSQAAVAARQAAAAAAQQALTAHQANKPRSRTNRPGDLDLDTEPADDLYLPGQDSLVAWHNELRRLQGVRQSALAAVEQAERDRDSLAGGTGRYGTALADLNGAISTLETRLAQQLGARNNAILARDAARQAYDTAVSQEYAAHTAWDTARWAMQTLLQQQWNQASETVGAHNVVDGLELYRRWRLAQRTSPPRWDATTIPWDDDNPATPNLGLPHLGTTDQVRVLEQLQALGETVDAVGDALVAESVYQLVQGNAARAGATLEAIASGEVAPPELAVARTPRTGTALTHRLLVLWNATLPGTPPWGASPLNPRALAEPYLNNWATQWLPHPSRVRCQVSFVDPTTHQVLHQSVLTLSTLQLSPLDAVNLAIETEQNAQGELEQRLVYAALRARPSSVPAVAELRLNLARDPAWAATIVSIPEFLESVRLARALVTGARALDARDLALPGEGVAVGVDTTDLQQRADQAAAALQQALQSLETARATASTDLEPLRAALLALAGFGIRGAIPHRATGTGADAQAALERQAVAVAQEAARRMQRLTQHTTGGVPATAERARDFHVTRLQIVFGEAFRVLGKITVTQPAALTQAFDSARPLLAGDATAPLTWLQAQSRVRRGPQRFWAALNAAEALGSGATTTLRIGQLPYVAAERWVALPPLAGQSLPPGRLSVVAHSAGALQFAQPLVGLSVDEWIEVVPSRREVTGVAFHFDQPGAQAPQSLLLAVHPDVRTTRLPAAWDLDTLAAVLGETIDLARTRAAAPDQLAGSLWHTVRTATGQWGPFVLVESAAGPLHGLHAVSAAGVGPALHLAVVTAAGDLWHTIRQADGTWQAWGDVRRAAGDRGTCQLVTCAAVGDTLHLCAITATSIWHTIRQPDGSWQPFGDVAQQAGRRGVPYAIACAGGGAELHVCLVTDDGRLWHTIRRADGGWYPWGDVAGQTGPRGHFMGVACAVINGALHVCATSTLGLWHAIRWADGRWTAFGDVTAQVGARGYVVDMACAGIGDELHLRLLTADNRVWHTIRYAAGPWMPCTEYAGLGHSRRVACTNVGATLHVADLSAAQPSPALYFASGTLDLNALPG